MAINPIVIKAHPDFVALVKKVKNDNLEKGIKLSDTSITKMLSDEFGSKGRVTWSFKLR